jgi:tetratricopeptide (TPR) repeat protein
MLACAALAALPLGREASAAPPVRAPSSQTDRAAYLKARGHIRRGDQQYDARRFQAAIREYQAAYRLLPLPDLLFNIAQSHRLAGDLPEAVLYYTKYLELPDGKAQRAARRHLQRLREQGVTAAPDRQPAPRPAAIPRPAPPPSAIPGAQPRPAVTVVDAPAPRQGWLGPVLTASGLAIAAAGAGLAISARLTYNDLQTSCAPACATSSWEGLPARHTAGIVLGGVGAAVTLGGAVLWILASRRPAASAVAVDPAGAGVVARLRF